MFSFKRYINKEKIKNIKKKIKKRQAIIIIPFCLVLIYLILICVEKYRSESSYIIRDLSSPENFGIELGIFGGGLSSQQQDANIVVEYLQSMDMLKKVEQKFKLREHYTSGQTDILERLFYFSSDEDFLNLYRKHLSIIIDELSGITHIYFESTDRRLSRQILSFLLKEGEAFLNSLNHQRAEKKITFAASQLTQNKVKLDQAISRLKEFQNQNSIVDPSADVAVNNSIISSLEASIVEKTAEYNQLISYMAPDTIDALKLKKLIQELKTALRKTKSKLSGSKNVQLNDLIFEFQKLKNEVDFATEVYKKTIVQHEISKIEALQISKIFEVIAAPSLPDGHIYPNRLKILMMTALLLAGTNKIAGLIWAIIKDHKD
ncbi:MAG: hypothetical protein GY874_22685 [Desulfobacteraceae bacterium]|nr:hypothetical protein [Desulfobacteraceae bacterium]